jgi:hypothetical protein
MRRSVPLAAVGSGHWEATGAVGIEMRTLNHDPVTGARTALIRSVPRQGVERRAHYQHCEEELLCLAGRFTFDGVHWMRALSYACYPPQVVHGARVSVPGGYLLYLRTSGPTQAYPVAEPVTDEAYHSADSGILEPIVVLEHTLEPLQDSPTDEAAAKRQAAATDQVAAECPRRRVLRTEPTRQAEVSLWEFGDSDRDLLRHFPVATPLEVLIVRVGAEAGDTADSPSLSYGFYGPGDARPSIDAYGPTVALVHAGPWA